MKKLFALLLALVMCLSLAACGQSQAAKETDEAIAAIGNVSLDSGEAILAAEELYTNLSEKDKSTLKHADTLEQAREEYDALLSEAMNRLSTPFARIAVALEEYNLVEAMDALTELRTEMSVANPNVLAAFVSYCGEKDVASFEATLANLEDTIYSACIHNTLIAKPEHVLTYASKGGWLVNDHGDFAAYNWWCTNSKDITNAYNDYKAYVSQFVEITDLGDSFTFLDNEGNTVTVLMHKSTNATLQVRVPRF